ncbi:MAG TPA: MBL fold metallo-hydrolase [Thermoanaerobaculia bacterium]|nr:MBL fold metallo-hydrolase [Thermoanaerobaculia bacterium]
MPPALRGPAMPRFTNLDPAHRPQPLPTVLRWALWDRLTGRRRIQPPGPPAPHHLRAPGEPACPAAGDFLTWIGHSSFLGRLGGASFLVDPVFSQRIGTFYPRYGEPGLRIAELPPLAALLISHNHYDHLDRPSLRALPPEAPALVPLGLGRWFRRWAPRPVVELAWWQRVELGSLAVTFVPARHWSNRHGWDVNRSWWGGFVIEGGGRAVYHAGDTAAFGGFAQIAARFPGLDAALLPIGAYEPGWFMEAAHLTPEQAGEAFLHLGARRLVPMHWGTFQLTDEPISEPIERMRAWWQRHAPAEGRQLAELAVGQSLVLGG